MPYPNPKYNRLIQLIKSCWRFKEKFKIYGCKRNVNYEQKQKINYKEIHIRMVVVLYS